MRKVVLSFLFCFFFLPLIACAAQKERSDLWDFGKIKEGQVVKHTFILKNESAKTLRIKGINTSCGCTISEIKKKILRVNESTEIEVKFDTSGYSGMVQQYVYVETDNLKEPILKFTIKADVVKK